MEKVFQAWMYLSVDSSTNGPAAPFLHCSYHCMGLCFKFSSLHLTLLESVVLISPLLLFVRVPWPAALICSPPTPSSLVSSADITPTVRSALLSGLLKIRDDISPSTSLFLGQMVTLLTWCQWWVRATVGHCRWLFDTGRREHAEIQQPCVVGWHT